MYKNPAATRVTVENCPPRIALDDASTSIPEVMEKVSNGFSTGDIIAYIWRQPQEKRDCIKESVIRGVFAPLAACLPFWEKGKWSENNPTFILSDVFDLASGRGIPGARDVTCQYRVEGFARPNGGRFGKSWFLMLNENGILSRSFNETDLVGIDYGCGKWDTFEQDFENGPPPHADGEIEDIHCQNKKRRSSWIDIRALTVYQGEGTFFWKEAPDELGVEWTFRERITIDPLCLQGREIFQAAAGDVIFFETGPRSWSECFIHQAAMAKPLHVNHFALNEARLLATYNMKLAI